MPGTGPWADAHAKAVALVSQMTLEEKANITVGYNSTTGCAGETGTVPRLGWGGLCINDAGNGKGLVTTAVTGGLPAGNYRVCTMAGSSNHQPVLMPVAQRYVLESDRACLPFLLFVLFAYTDGVLFVAVPRMIV